MTKQVTFAVSCPRRLLSFNVHIRRILLLRSTHTICPVVARRHIRYSICVPYTYAMPTPALLEIYLPLVQPHGYATRPPTSFPSPNLLLPHLLWISFVTRTGLHATSFGTEKRLSLVEVFGSRSKAMYKYAYQNRYKFVEQLLIRPNYHPMNPQFLW